MWEDGALMSALGSSDEKRGSRCGDQGVQGGSLGTPEARLDAGRPRESKVGLSSTATSRPQWRPSQHSLPRDLRKRFPTLGPAAPSSVKDSEAL